MLNHPYKKNILKPIISVYTGVKRKYLPGLRNIFLRVVFKSMPWKAGI